MSAEILRQAAALMRERAEAATRGSWSASGDVSWAVLTDRPCYCDEPFCECDPVAAEVVDGHDAVHIASWHPAVALAVADLLTRLADRAADIADTIGSSRVADDVVTNNLLGYREALAVARTYLGEQP